MEVWKDVIGFEGLYEVSDLGRVRRSSPGANNTYAGRIVKQFPGRHGYMFAGVYKDGKRRSVIVHTAVLRAFIGPKPEGMECCHGDGVRTNNSLSNLRWDTHKNNALDTVTHCSTQWASKITKSQAREIRERYKNSRIKQRELAAEYGISQPQVSQILSGKRWRSLTK